MTTFAITEAKSWHCGQMARLLRLEQYDSVTALGFDPHRELRKMFDISAFRRAWMIDDTLAALGGVTGAVMSQTGLVWLALSRRAMGYPVAVVREARTQLSEIMATKSALSITMTEGDEAAKRLAVFLGFVPRLDFSPAESKFGRKSIHEYCDNDITDRIRYGNGSLLIMYLAGQRREAA